MSRTAANAEFTALRIAVLTLSDSRTADDDTSGDFLVGALEAEGHRLARRKIVKDEKYVIRAEISALIADGEVDVILTTGSTGLTGRDVRITLDGGEIAVRWADDGVWMTGPTGHVFDGVWLG